MQAAMAASALESRRPSLRSTLNRKGAGATGVEVVASVSFNFDATGAPEPSEEEAVSGPCIAERASARDTGSLGRRGAGDGQERLENGGGALAGGLATRDDDREALILQTVAIEVGPGDGLSDAGSIR